MTGKLTLSPLVLLAFVGILTLGELASGTRPYFVFMMAVGVFSACITYNVLGGLGSIAGIGFSGFALGTLVISQIGKVLLFERADKNLDVPQLTITVYAVYFFFLMLGTFVFSRLRLPLLKPAEPKTSLQTRTLYLVSFAGGLAGTIGLIVLGYAGENTSLAHGFMRALSYLLPFSLVLAVDIRLRATEGKHIFGWMAFWPAVTMMFEGFIAASRTGFVEPLAIVALTCYVRNVQFKRRHIVAGLSIGAFFFFFVSPFYLFARAARGEATVREQIVTMVNMLESAPSQWDTITASVGEQAISAPGSVSYFSTPGAVTLNRFALIGPDSTLINACSTGFHYGWTALKLDFLGSLPRFVYRNRPDIGAADYLGQLDGQESDQIETTTYSTITPISDSFGAFAWIGVALFAFFVAPAIFVVYQSIFDIWRPWGTVATVLLMFGVAGGSMGGNIFTTMIRDPIYLIVLSWCAAWVVKMIPVSGDRAIPVGTIKSGPFRGGRMKDEPSESTV